MRILKFCLICFILFIYFDNALAQDITFHPAKEILESVEEKYNLTFSFLDDIILNKSLPEPPPNVSEKILIKWFEKHLSLAIEKTDSRQYVISTKVPAKMVCGFIIDSESADPVVGATIRSSRLSVSDENGFFILEVGDENIIEIKTVSYETLFLQSKDFGINGYDTIPLDLKTTILPEITISNYLSKGIDRAEDGSLLFRVAPLKALPGLIESDVLHTLQFLPGIQSIDETVSDVNIRGGTNDQNLVLYNGVRSYQTSHFFGLISAFNPHVVKEAQLVKNGTSVAYGDAVSGTIILKNQTLPPDSAGIQLGMNMIYVDTEIALPIGRRSGIYLNGRRSLGDLLNTPTYQSYFDRAFRDTQVINSSQGAGSLANSDQNFTFYDLNLNYIYQFSERERLQLFGFIIENSIDFVENAVVNNITESRNSRLDQESQSIGLNYTNWWSSKFTTESIASVSNYNLEASNINLFEDQRLFQQNAVLDYQFKTTSRYLFNKSDVLFGYQYNNVGVNITTEINNPDFRQRVKNVLTTHAIFAESNRKLGRLSIRAGVRGNYFYELNLGTLEPRIYVSIPMAKRWKIELSGEKKSQNLIQRIDLQTDFLGVEKRKWELVNNRELSLLTSYQFTTGLEFKSDPWLIHIEGYTKNVQGISTISQGFINQYRSVIETGNYKVNGLDFLMSLKSHDFSTWFSYSLSRNRYHFLGLTPPDFPSNFDIPNAISTGGNFKWEQWLWSAGLNWHTGRPFTRAKTTGINELLFEEPNTRRLRNYMRLDFSTNYSFEISEHKAIIAASVWNILNRENIIQAYYQNIGNSYILEERNALSLTMNLSFRIDL